MKKFSLLLVVLLFVCSVRADEVKVMQDNTYAIALSPNGQYLVGHNPTQVVFGIETESFLYNAGNATLNWITANDAGTWATCGQFKDVNDAGTICGSVKDLQHYVQFDGTYAPTNIAAVFDKGKIYRLPYGDLDTTKIKQHEDGTFARSISNDGKVVVGYCRCSNSAFNYPCKWNKGDDGEWTFEKLALPEGYSDGLAIGVSANGRTIVGLAIKGRLSHACYWIDGVCHLVKCTEEDAKLANQWQMRVMDISNNGRFFIFTLTSYFGNLRIFDVESGTYRALSLFDNNGRIQIPSITDNGDVFGSINYTSFDNAAEIYYRNFWYQYSSNRLFDLSYYLYLFSPNLTTPFSMSYEDKTQAFPCAISADGNAIAGNKDILTVLGQTPTAWLLNVNKTEREIPATPDKITGNSTGLRQATLTWAPDKNTYNSLTLKGYNVYCDGKKVATLNEVKDKLTVTLNDQPAGYLQFTVEGVYSDKQGKEMLSPRSNPVSVTMPENYAFPLFDDFEKESLNTNYWTTDKDYGDDNEGLWSAGPYIGHGGSYGVASGANSSKPYSSSLISRPLDATRAKRVKCSFIILCQSEQIGDEAEHDLTQDTLSVEYSIDKGNSWQTAKSWTIAQLPKVEGIMSIDLTKQVAEKTFQLRFHKYGTGVGKYYFYLDNISIGKGDDAEAPEGLIGQNTPTKDVFLAWKNGRKSYSLNYLSEPEVPGLTLGNEGKELIGANKFTGQELSMYHGKYLTSVTTRINYYEEEAGELGIHAAVVVFENGKLVCEQEIENINYNQKTTQALAKPIMIDSCKELIVGIKIHDYDENQLPLLYAHSKACVTGKSDLFSEDNGATWKTVWDFYNGDPYNGACCWEITGNVTDEADATVKNDDDSLIGYNIFRNGMQLNNICIPGEGTRYTDKQPLDKAEYTVVAYYIDGRESSPSMPFVINQTSITTPLPDNSLIYIDDATAKLKVKGTLCLLTVDGRIVAQSEKGILSLKNIPSGIYIVLAECNNQSFTKKIAIRN